MGDTRTLLLTDMVDSTTLSERLGDVAMAALWARHDRVARDLLRPHHGREIDKTDGFLLLFTSVADAVAYAVAYHRALVPLGVKARAGIHVGPVILTENAAEDVALGAKPLEVDGLAKPVAARVMGVASGGQTLLTAEARAALGDTPFRVASHGRWRMKGVAEPMELFEVGDDEAPFTPPPDGAKVYRVVERDGVWLPVREVRHNLPAERDGFVGRHADLRALAESLERGRLVSVLGMGGTGKTRLVTRFGWTWLGDFPGGVWFCDLSEARDADGIVAAVARALDVQLGAGDPVSQLGHAIAGRGSCLVLLDNFEQVARHAGETLARWLDRAVDARFVVTTREVLGVPGEVALALAPLVSADGVDLFLSRARAANRDFVADDLPSVDALVRLLDGLPLAIELAAARVRVMPPKVLLARMGERFRLLASAGSRQGRQATLRGALDWSWELLSADERQALAQLSVFEGGFGLDAAEGVLALDELWPMDAVQALVDKSLVRPLGPDRFDLLVSVQEYAAEKLETLGQRRETEVRHAAFFAPFGTPEALAALDVHGGVARRKALGVALDNLTAACHRAVQRGDAATALPLVQAAATVLARRGPFHAGIALAAKVGSLDLPPRDRESLDATIGHLLALSGRSVEGRRHLEAALASATGRADPIAVGRHLTSLAYVAIKERRLDEARAHLEAALDRLHGFDRRQVDDAVLRARILLGNVLFAQGRPVEESLRHWHQSLERAREIGHRIAEGDAQTNLGNGYGRAARVAEARASYEAGLAVQREVGSRESEAITLGHLGLLERSAGRLSEALDRFEAALAIRRELGNPAHVAESTILRAGVLADLGRHAEARAAYHAALRLLEETGAVAWLAMARTNLGLLEQLDGRPAEARAHFEEAVRLNVSTGDRSNEGLSRVALGLVDQAEGKLSDARSQFETALALARETDWVVAEGEALGCLGDLAHAEGRHDEARAAFDAAEPLIRANPAYPSLLGVLLANRCRLDRATGRTEAARAALAEAEAIGAQIGCLPRSELGQALARARG